MDYQKLHLEFKNGTLTEKTLKEFQNLLELRLRQKYKNVVRLASLFGIDSSDLVQELLLKTLIVVRTFNKEKITSTYLYRCLDNAIYNLFHRFKSNCNKGVLVQREQEDLPIADRGFDQVDNKEELNFLLKKLAKLPEKEKEILGLRLDGLSFEQIGKKFGVSKEAVRQRFQKIIPKIRRR